MWLGSWLRGLVRPRVSAESGEGEAVHVEAPSGSNDSVTTVQAAGLAVHGEPATAVVLAVTPVDVPWGLLAGPAASVVDLDVRVTRLDGRSYPVTVRVGFSTARRRTAVAAIGATIPVRVDPDNPARVAVDMARLNAAD